jgi:hypothetical protein
MTDTIRLNPHVIRKGLSLAQNWTKGPILCWLTPQSTRLVVVNEYRFVAVWEWQEENEARPCFFLVPPFIASTLSGPASWHLARMEVMLHRNNVALIMHDERNDYVLQWRWDPWIFRAPTAFQKMIAQPGDIMRSEYVAIADAVHLAVANLGRMEGLEQVRRDRLAMTIDFSPGRLIIDGQEIIAGDSQQFYFDPRLVIRALEISQARAIGLSMSKLPENGQSILHIGTDREQWQVRCAVLSLSREETHLPNYNLTVGNGSKLSPVPGK